MRDLLSACLRHAQHRLSRPSANRRRAVSLVALLMLVACASCGTDAETTTQEVDPPRDPVVRSGPDQTVLGPSGNIDSLYATVRDADGLHAYMSNEKTIWYDQEPDGTLTNGRIILRKGPKGSVDHCGVHPTGAIYKVTDTHWVSFYHAEQANPHQYDGRCLGGPGKRNLTRMAVFELTTRDGGQTWHKGPEVLTQDKDLIQWSTDPELAKRDDAGSPRVVIHGDYLYMFYRAVNQDSPDTKKMSVARAPTSSHGKPGSWKKLYRGSFSEPGIGGHQSAIEGLPAAARGVSWNTYLKSYISVRASMGGITLYRSDGSDLTTWKPLEQIADRFATRSAWGMPCVAGQTPDFPAAVGYAATIGWKGSTTTTGRNFWVYYMYKPKGNCFSDRFLVRRQVALDAKLKPYPHPTVSTGVVE